MFSSVRRMTERWLISWTSSTIPNQVLIFMLGGKKNFSYVRWMRRRRLQTSPIWRRDVLSQPFSAIFVSLAAHLKNDVHICDTLLTYGRNYGLSGSCEWLSHNRTESERLPILCRLSTPCNEPITAKISLSVSYFPSHRHEKYVCFHNTKLGLPLYHVASGTMEYFDGTGRLRARAEGFLLSLHMRVWDSAVRRSTVWW